MTEENRRSSWKANIAILLLFYEYERMSGIAAFDWSHRSTLLALISDAGQKLKFHL